MAYLTRFECELLPIIDTKAIFMDFLNLTAVLSQPPNVSQVCNASLQVLLGDLLDREMYAINMIDAWAKPEAGILYGSHVWLGSYDQCLEQKNRTISAEYFITSETGAIQNSYLPQSF